MERIRSNELFFSMEIKEIKNKLSIDKVLTHYHLKADRNNMLNCPFHEDKTPSMQIYPKTNSWCCFSGNCKAGTGDVIQFIELKENCSKHEAILKAKEMLVSVAPAIATSNYKEDLNMIFQKLKQNIIKSPKAQGYLKERHLNTEQLEVGYNAKTYHSLKNCIVFPLKDCHGQTVSLYGRSVTANINNKHYYTVNRKGLYPKYPKQSTKKLILTESVIDASTLLQNVAITNHYEILGLYGTNGLTTEHVHAIQQLEELQEVILWLDGDKAGKAAIEKHGKYLQELLPTIKITIVETPEGEGINSLLDACLPDRQGHEAGNLPDGSQVFTELLGNRRLFSLPSRQAGSIEQGAPAGNKLNVPIKTKLDVVNGDCITYQKDQLKFTLLGGISLQHLDRLRITLKLNKEPQLNPMQSIRHNMDLYNDDQTEKFCRKAASKLEIGTSIIQQSMSELTEALEEYRMTQIESKKEKKPKTRILTQEEKAAAINYLKAPNLLTRTNEDIAKTGVVGEVNNRLLMYLVFTSRLREQPLHIISLGASGTGKTYLQEKIAELIPEQDKLEITILSDNAFYYFEQKALANKLVLIEDMDGAENVLYPLRELMSKKRISKSVTIKDNKGTLRTITLKVEGPICVAGTTTKEKIYEDNANRSILIYGDNTKVHQEKIMNYQRAVSAGQIAHHEEERVKGMFKDMQTMLKPIKVRNPYAEQLKIPQEVFKPLRTNTHYLQFIECITFYHQYQRTVSADKYTGEQYITTELEDIAWANKLLKDVLLSKADELSGACRSFFEVLKVYLLKEKKTSFYTKEIRQTMRMNPHNLKYYTSQLAKYGYLRIVGGDRYKQGFEYEVINTEEYNHLKSNITNALDEALQKIRKQPVASVANRSNYPLN